MEREYIAFISYRHKKLDTEIAKQLHRLIEHYRIPQELRKGKSGRLGYVFRDRDELPLSSDLSADIKKALDKSRFLIVVCTPDTPKSPWIKLEIEYFLEHHDRECVLAVLVKGSPGESFPEQITHVFEKDGITLSRIIEPLAANVVSSSKIKRRYLLKAEFIRLAAAILGCPYDALKQRQRRFRQWQLSMAAMTVAVVATGFAVMLMLKNQEIRTQSKEIQQKNQEIQIRFEESQKNESYALSLVSDQLLGQGDRIGAVETVLRVLPSTVQERPLSVDAELALCNALYTYQDEEMRAVCQLEQETEIEKLVMSRDGGYAVTLDEYGRLRCYDGYRGELLWEKAVETYLTDYLAIMESEQAVFYFYHNVGCFLFSLEDGTVLQDYSDIINEYGYVNISNTQETMAYVTTNPEDDRYIHFYRLPTFEPIAESPVLEIPDYYVYSDSFSLDGTRYAVCFSSGQEGEYIYTIYVFDTGTGELLHSISYEEQERLNDIRLIFLPDDDLMIFHCKVSPDKQYLERIDGKTGKIEYSREFTEEYFAVSPSELLLNDSMLVCVSGNNALIFELETGNLLKHEHLLSYCEACYWLDETRQEYVVAGKDGTVSTINMPDYNSEIHHEDKISFDTGMELSEVHGSSEGADYVCVVPEEEKNRAVIYRYKGDEEKKRLSVPVLTDFDQVLDQPTGDIYLLPSGNRAI